jgi:hypothetical protein
MPVRIDTALAASVADVAAIPARGRGSHKLPELRPMAAQLKRTRAMFDAEL